MEHTAFFDENALGKQNSSFTWSLLLCSLLAVAVLVIDLLLPLGVAGGVPYVAVVLLALQLPGQRYLLGFTILCTALTIFGAFSSPPGGEVWQVITNRLLAIGAIWITTTLLLQHRRGQIALRRNHRKLKSCFQERILELTAVYHQFQQEHAEHQKIKQALQESEARYHSLIDDVLDTSQVGVFILNSTFHIVWMNRAIERYFGLQRDALLGKDKRQLINAQIKHTFEQSEHFAKKVLATYDNNTYVEHFECHVLPTEERPERWLEHWSQPIYSGFYAGGRIEHYYDITARKQAEDRIRQQEAELSHMARLSVASEMGEALAHELNQPLTVISNDAHICWELLCSSRVSSPNQILKLIEEIGHQSSRASEIINRLRAFIRKTEFRKAPANLNTLIQEVIPLAEVEARQQEVHLQLKLAPDLPSVLADNIQLQQVILNLVRNSIEAMRETPEGERDLTLRTALHSSGTIEVAISDTGSGLSSEAMKKLFQPFFTTKSTGMGLGLSLSKSIIEAHGGKLWATPHPERGVTFHFTVPIEKRES